MCASSTFIMLGHNGRMFVLVTKVVHYLEIWVQKTFSVTLSNCLPSLFLSHSVSGLQTVFSTMLQCFSKKLFFKSTFTHIIYDQMFNRKIFEILVF